MLARLQQAITLSLLALVSIWFVVCVRYGHPVLGACGVVLIAGGYAWALAIEFVLLYRTHGADPTPRATATQLLRAWACEAVIAPRVFCWRQPFRTWAQPDLLSPDISGRRGVLLVHGFVCNRAFWNPWLTRLREDGTRFVAVNLEPVFGAIDCYAASIEEGMRRLEHATGAEPVIVAHSMGGLAVRVWLDAYQADLRVHRVITIGTPHQGTWLGRFGRTPNTRQMRLDGPWIRALAERTPPKRAARFTCFYSHCDNIVFPPSVATLSGADNRHLAGWSHVHLTAAGEVFEELKRCLR